jgi:methionine-rich copper-binding protein CopC
MNRRILLLAFGAALATPSLAHAHAMLVRSDPAAGATISTSPTAITISFTQRVDAGRCSVELDGPNGDQVALGALAATGDGSILSAPISGALSAGAYRVRWRATNMEGHQTSGDFEFRVTA